MISHFVRLLLYVVAATKRAPPLAYSSAFLSRKDTSTSCSHPLPPVQEEMPGDGIISIIYFAPSNLIAHFPNLPYLCAK